MILAEVKYIFIIITIDTTSPACDRVLKQLFHAGLIIDVTSPACDRVPKQLFHKALICDATSLTGVPFQIFLGGGGKVLEKKFSPTHIFSSCFIN